MAANIIPIGSPRFRSSSVVSSHRNPHHRSSSRRNISYRNNWWSPLFGYSASESDYVDSRNNNEEEEEEDKSSGSIEGKIDSDPANKSGRFAPGGFTEEKARHLRLLTTAADTASFHEVMYHSAIASRLASDFSKR